MFEFMRQSGFGTQIGAGSQKTSRFIPIGVGIALGAAIKAEAAAPKAEALAAKGGAGAESAINQGRLRSQLLAEGGASGHTF